MAGGGENRHRQYGQPNLLENIRRALRRGGKTLEDLTLDEAAAFSEFHIGGRRATREIAARVGLRPGLRVLDLGCGVGGPARTLAAEFGCRVTGVDATAAFCEAACALNEQRGLDQSIKIIHGDVLSVELGRTFDVVWLQHVAANVGDKEALISRISRWLDDGGRLVFHEIFSGTGGSPRFPVPWADGPEMSDLCTMREFTRLLERHGFQQEWSEDVSAESLAWFERAITRIETQGVDRVNVPGVDLLMGERAPEKMRNVVRNLKEERIHVGQGLWRKPSR